MSTGKKRTLDEDSLPISGLTSPVITESDEHRLFRPSIVRPRIDSTDIFFQQHQLGPITPSSEYQGTFRFPNPLQKSQEATSPGDRGVQSSSESESSLSLTLPGAVRSSSYHPKPGGAFKEVEHHVHKENLEGQSVGQDSLYAQLQGDFPVSQYPSASSAVNAILSLHHRGISPMDEASTRMVRPPSLPRKVREGESEDDVDRMFSFAPEECIQTGIESHGTIPDQQKQFETLKTQHSQTKTISTPDSKDKVSKQQAVTFKRSCKICTERRVKCSGPPGPCVTCLKKGLGRDLCVFLPRRKPGPKKREFDLLLGLSSTLSLTDDQFVSESVHLVFSEYSVSIQVANVITDLRAGGFLTSELLSSPFQNEAYAKKSILRAVRLWVTLFGEHTLDISSSEFVHLIKSYQESSGENHELSDSDLEMLYWLCCPGEDSDDLSPRMLLSQLCLVFIWLGPANAEVSIDGKTAVRQIYQWIHAEPDRVLNYDGICARVAVEKRIASGETDCVYFLNEGRVECVKTGVETRGNVYKIRCLGKCMSTEEFATEKGVSFESLTADKLGSHYPF